MTEQKLFRNSLLALGSTIVIPAIVGIMGLGAPNGLGAHELVKQYVTGSPAQTQSQVSKQDAKDDKRPVATDSIVKNDKPSTTLRPSYAGAKAAGNYTVKEGDTYGCIAEKYYGSYDQWTKVYDRNGGWPGYEEYSLAVGAVLEMPAVSADEALPKTHLCE